MRKLNSVDAINKNQMEYDASRRLEKNKLTIQEYNEIMFDIDAMYYKRKVVETICAKVKEFLQMYGVHIEEKGAGWEMMWL